MINCDHPNCKKDTKNIPTIAVMFGWKAYYHEGHWMWYCPEHDTPFPAMEKKEKQQNEK